MIIETVIAQLKEVAKRTDTPLEVVVQIWAHQNMALSTTAPSPDDDRYN